MLESYALVVSFAVKPNFPVFHFVHLSDSIPRALFQCYIVHILWEADEKKNASFKPKPTCQSFHQNQRQSSSVQERVAGTTTAAPVLLSTSLRLLIVILHLRLQWTFPFTQSAFMWWSNQLISTGNRLSFFSSFVFSSLTGLVLKKKINESTKSLRPELVILIALFFFIFVCQPNGLVSSFSSSSPASVCLLSL